MYYFFFCYRWLERRDPGRGITLTFRRIQGAHFMQQTKPRRPRLRAGIITKRMRK